MQREVENCSRRIAEKELGLKSRENIFRRKIDNLNNWWEGRASYEFLRQYKGVQYDINKLYFNIKKIENGLKRLVYQIKRAEEERRREEIERIKRMKESIKA